MSLKLVFASDSFKGSLTSKETAELLKEAAGEVFSGAFFTGLTVADGGEGTVEAIVEAAKGEYVYTTVHGPLFETVNARYGIITDKTDKGSLNLKKTAVIEMAAASGLTLLPLEKRNPLKTTSFGTGELILDALEKGILDIVIGIGGSATNDGGMGCLKVLGVRILDKNGVELDGTGENLECVAKIDTSSLDDRAKNARITVLCDVTNPLCGENGATKTFGPQKGADSEMLERLEKGMQNYKSVIARSKGVDPDLIRGAGAAGGLGAALSIFLNGEMRPGTETVLSLAGFDRALDGASLVITGEGKADASSCFGKTVQGVGSRAKKKGVPVVALCGSVEKGAEALLECGIDKIIGISDKDMPLEYAMTHVRELYKKAAVRLFCDIRTGLEQNKSIREILRGL